MQRQATQLGDHLWSDGGANNVAPKTIQTCNGKQPN